MKMTSKPFVSLILSSCCCFILLGASAFAEVPAASQSSAPPSASVADAGVREVEKPLQVNGQTRNLSMLMQIKSEKDQINFLDIRRNYKNEVSETSY